MNAATDSPSQQRQPAEGAGVRELRLALVLYGGVSLAIYMHGVTKEIHRLVKGSASVDESTNDLTSSERVYRDLASGVDGGGVRTRVVVDTVAGSSAGGINGVYLTKALAHDLSQDALRNLWLERGDMRAILRGHKMLPWTVRVPWVLATLPWKAPLHGDLMAAWLYEALADMDRPSDASEGAEGRSLMPPGHVLELFVTLTDYHGYARQMVLDSPPIVTEPRQRHVLEFRRDHARDDFRADSLSNAALAFAARGTSSLPGGFPPLSFSSFERDLRRHAGVSVDLSQLNSAPLFRQYELSGGEAGAAFFIDGGVLDNKPFGPVISAIQRKRATVEVDRRLLFLDPNPVAAEAQRRARRAPAPVAAGTRALLGIRGAEPILDDIFALQERNERVRELRDVIEASWDAVAALVTDVVGADALADPPADPSDGRLDEWTARLHERAGSQAGFSHNTYVRAKVADAVSHWAEAVCRLLGFPRDSAQAAFVRAVLNRWAREEGLYQHEQAEPSDEQMAFLQDVDLGYRERRLRFVLAGLGWWYHPEEEGFPVPDREQLDEASRPLSDALDKVTAALRGEDLPGGLVEQVRHCFAAEQIAPYLEHGPDGTKKFMDASGAALADLATQFRAAMAKRFAGLRGRLYGDVRRHSAGWHPEARRRLMVRYLGFPVWDALLFPFERLAGIGEQDHIEIDRLSPGDASLIPPLHGPDEPKLQGMRHHHLGAFFKRDGRERDYLWGRLDTAERLVTLLLGDNHTDRELWCHRAFAAILEEEDGALPHATDLVDHVGALLRKAGLARSDVPTAR